jgi:hypothetical protein
MEKQKTHFRPSVDQARCHHRPNNGSQHHKHISYYSHDVSIGIGEAGKEGEKKKVLITVFHAWE